MAEPLTDLSKPSPLRLAGFLLIAAGGLLGGLGAVLLWVTVGLAQDVQGVISQRYLGVDLLDGKFVLGCALILLVGIVLLRRVLGKIGLWVASALMLATLAMTAISASAVLGAKHRFGDRALQDMAATTASALKIPIDQARQVVEGTAALGLTVNRGIGLWLVLLGGLLGLAGSVLSMIWAARPRA